MDRPNSVSHLRSLLTTTSVNGTDWGHLTPAFSLCRQSITLTLMSNESSCIYTLLAPSAFQSLKSSKSVLLCLKSSSEHQE
eukprot:scaffold15883_cov41-Prasinocladus_malaysianus.AAC.1